MRKLNRKKSSRVIFSNLTIGLELAAVIFIFVYGGHKLDLHYDKSPLFVGIGTVLGLVIGFYHLIKNLERDRKLEEKNKEKESKKTRWM